MEQKLPESAGLRADEHRLVRLFRCLNQAEQHHTLVEISQSLMRRYSVDPLLGRLTPAEETLAEELSPENVEDYDERLLQAWPGDWPEKRVGHLDNLGDPGAVLGDCFGGDAIECILGSSANDGNTADMLVETYLAECERWAVPLPTEFGASQEEMEKWIHADFLDFVRLWRERVISTMERQARGSQGP